MSLTSKIPASGTIIAQDVTDDAFLDKYGDNPSNELAGGCVIDMPAHDEDCQEIQSFLAALFRNYFAASGQAGYVAENALLKMDGAIRRPDVVIHHSASNTEDRPLAEAMLIVEISTPESHRRDRVEKFLSYEAAGIPEYWVIDMATEEALFYQLNDNGLYELAELDEAFIYHSQSLPKLQLSPEVFWQETLPDAQEVIDLAKSMLR